MPIEKKNLLIYWILTLPFTLLMLMSAVGYLIQAPQMVEGMAQLGYPLYLLKIIGTAKILGVLAIFFNRITFLKEWAYAGFTINLIGAAASHYFTGEYNKVIPPLVILLFVWGSYRYWKK